MYGRLKRVARYRRLIVLYNAIALMGLFIKIMEAGKVPKYGSTQKSMLRH